MNKTFYITTAIDYANASPHLGHAYEKIAADVLSRWNRNCGKEVFFLTGTDEHGQKVFETAKKNNQTPKEFVDNISSKFIKFIEALNISNDFFIRTTNPSHKKFVQKMLNIAYKKGDIYKDIYNGYYCVGCEKYFGEEDLEKNEKKEFFCPIHKKKLEKKEEENYFFKLSKYEKTLLELYEKNPNLISPKSKKNEILNRIKKGLKDISISRKKENLPWGIELPFDKEHITYVWFDALFNYISALEICNKKKFWPADVHLVGHDISWFHLVYWPAMLISCNYNPPKKIFSHGMILDEKGHKMSKSLGNIIDPIKEIKKFGLDEFRYYLLSLGTFGEDLNYSHKTFIEKINNELNNDFGNLISRVHSMTYKYFNGTIPQNEIPTEKEKELLKELDFFTEFDNFMQNLEFHKAIDLLWKKIRKVNFYINETEPWKEKNKKRLAVIINTLVYSIKIFGEFIDCFMPSKAEKLRKQFNFKKENPKNISKIHIGHKISNKENLFFKIKTEKNTNIENKTKNSKNKENKISFKNLNLKIGKILSAKKHPNAERLYVEKIDIGEKEPITIVSGLKGHYECEELIGKKVVVVCNLKKSNLRGICSEGMLLVSEDKNKNVGLLECNKAKIGDFLKCGFEEAKNKEKISIDKFFQLKIISDGKKIYFNNNEIKTQNNQKITIDKNISGKVC